MSVYVVATKLLRIKTKDEYTEMTNKYKNDLVILFFRAYWCTPCKVITPMVEECVPQIPKGLLWEIDVDELDWAARKFKIVSLPCFVFLRNRMEVDRYTAMDAFCLPIKMMLPRILEKCQYWSDSDIDIPKYVPDEEQAAPEGPWNLLGEFEGEYGEFMAEMKDLELQGEFYQAMEEEMGDHGEEMERRDTRRSRKKSRKGSKKGSRSDSSKSQENLRRSEGRQGSKTRRSADKKRESRKRGSGRKTVGFEGKGGERKGSGEARRKTSADKRKSEGGSKKAPSDGERRASKGGAGGGAGPAGAGAAKKSQGGGGAEGPVPRKDGKAKHNAGGPSEGGSTPAGAE